VLPRYCLRRCCYILTSWRLRAGSVAAAVAILCGVAAACMVLTASGVTRPARQELLAYPQQYPEKQLSAGLPARAQMLGPKAASFVRRWSEQAEQAAMSPKKQILALKAQGVPIIFPSSVIDMSGNLQKMVCLLVLLPLLPPLVPYIGVSQ